MKKLFTRKRIIAAVLLIAGVWGGSFLLGKYRSRASANAREILITNLEDYKAYEALDREQAGYLADAKRLEALYNSAKDRKAILQLKIGAPKEFVEKRQDDKNPNSPVIGFVEPPPPTPK